MKKIAETLSIGDYLKKYKIKNFLSKSGYFGSIFLSRHNLLPNYANYSGYELYYDEDFHLLSIESRVNLSLHIQRTLNEHFQ